MNDDGAVHAVVLERTLDAPVDLVWQMWTDPDHFKEWYGPDGATIPVANLDVRVGGNRLVCMQMETPNGAMQMWFAGEYREVVVNERSSTRRRWPTSTATCSRPRTWACRRITRSRPR